MKNLNTMEQEKTMNGTARNELGWLDNETMEGLIDHLKRNLKLQEQQPGNLVYTMLGPDFQDLYMCLDAFSNIDGIYTEDELANKPCTPDMIAATRVKISNCELDWFDGSAPLEGTLGEEPKLQLKVAFWQMEKYYERFKALPLAGMFTEVTHKTKGGDVLCQYFIDCGCDVSLMAALYTTILDKVYGVKRDDATMENFSTHAVLVKGQTGMINDKAGLKAELEQYGLPRYNMAYINSKMLIGKDVLDDVKALVDEYNGTYSEKTRIRLDLDEGQRQLTRVFLNDAMPQSSFFIPRFIKSLKKMSAINKMHDCEAKINQLARLQWE